MIATAGPEDYRRAVGLLLDDPGVDAVIAIYVSAGLGTPDEVAAAIRKGRDGSAMAGKKPVVNCIMAHVGIRGGGAEASWREPDSEDPGRHGTTGAPPTPRSTPHEPSCTSRSWGGVHLDIREPQAVREAWKTIRERLRAQGREDAMEGVTVQPMAPPGVETIVGMTHDPSFGPIVAFGLGGVAVELLRDVAFRITPLTDRDAAEILDDIKGHLLLDGYRGSPPSDKVALIDLLLRVSRLAEEVPQIAEINLNLVRVFAAGDGLAVLDARVLLR